MNAILLTAFGAAALLSACALAPPGGPQSEGQPAASQTFTSGLGENHKIGRTIVTPVSVVEDSRCPMGVQCIQAGTVRVIARLTIGGVASDVTVGLGKPAEASGRRLELLEVYPYPRHPNPISPSDYRFMMTLAAATS